QSPNGKLPLLMKTEDLPNAFMVRKDVLAKCGPFDSSTFPIHYEEADFCYRVRSRGYDVSVVTSAKTWHDIPLERRLSSTLRPFCVPMPRPDCILLQETKLSSTENGTGSREICYS